MNNLVDVILWCTTVAMAIMAGVYFCFSAFVMRSLDALGTQGGMSAMQSINRIILKSAFLPLFFGSTLSAIALAIVAASNLLVPGNAAMLAGTLVYVAGMFVVTVSANVPLNNLLEATDPAGPEGERIWDNYMRRWVPWNHVRTVSCTSSTILLIAALVARS